ncbi:hypothetical protein TSAR_010357 [Trichomalopsis sarcophagae]|uniref:RRM domain-containing protein n=1 Tax=Trichomalopsis sarcophagae TaxID=543379 RepID=A0A232F831_9HYME|nr:hypothetical protein TSAR_010357 [Trichomalopsis sarcophagae]
MTDNSTKVGETSSGEVVNGFRSCRDLSDIVPLYTTRAIYLKPIAKIHVSINLPQLKSPGKTISTWEVMEKVRLLIRPDEFASLKVVKSTLEFIRFEGDLGDKSRLQRVLARLDGQRLNLAGFPNVLKVKAAEVKDDFPTRHSWDSYFRDAKHMNELKAGERPDTIHISGLPVKWFSEDGGNTPSEPLIAKIFKRYGTLRRVDVPAADPYRSRMRLGATIQKFSYEDGIFFDAYIQYVEYMDFVRAMDALRGMKLLRKEKEKNHLVASIKVDFDKTKHMSDNSVSHREFERKRLIAQDNLAAEKLRRKEEAEAKKREEQKKKEETEMKGKDSRRRTREEKRKRKALTVFRKQEEDKVSLKIAREEKKLIKAQRQLESIRLLDALFDRIKIKIEKNEIDIKPKAANDKKDEKSGVKDENATKEDTDNSKKKDKAKNKKKNKKEKKKKKKLLDLSDSDTDKKKNKDSKGKDNNDEADADLPYADGFPRLPPQAWYYNTGMPLLVPPVRGFSRGARRGRGRGRWRGNHSGGGGNYQQFSAQEYNEQYYKYFASLVGQDYHDFIESDYEDKPRSRSRSQHRPRSKSLRRVGSDATRSSSRSKKRRRSPSKKRTKSMTRSRSKRRSRSRSRSRSKTRNGSKSRSRRRRRTPPRAESRVRVTRAKSRSGSPPRRRSCSSTWSLPKSPGRRSCSWSRNADDKTDKSAEQKKSTVPAEEESLTPKEKRKDKVAMVDRTLVTVKPG